MKRAFWSPLVQKDLKTSNLSLVGDHKLNNLTHLSHVSNDLSKLLIIESVHLFTYLFNFTNASNNVCELWNLSAKLFNLVDLS